MRSFFIGILQKNILNLQFLNKKILKYKKLAKIL